MRVAVSSQVNWAACASAPVAEPLAQSAGSLAIAGELAARSASSSTSRPLTPVGDGVDVAGDAGGDGRGAAGGGLGERHAPALAGRGAGDGPRRLVEVDQLVVGHAAGEA